MTALDTGVVLFATPETRVEGREKVSGRLRTPPTSPGPERSGPPSRPARSPTRGSCAIDVAAARAIPGVRAVLTGADIGRGASAAQLYDWPVLAATTVRFIGDRVAAVAAETREAAEAAARADRRSTYEELPAVLDPEAALAADAPVLHPEWRSILTSPIVGDRPSPRARASRTCRARCVSRRARRISSRSSRARTASSSTVSRRRASTRATSSRARRSCGSTTTAASTCSRRTRRRSRCGAQLAHVAGSPKSRSSSSRRRSAATSAARASRSTSSRATFSRRPPAGRCATCRRTPRSCATAPTRHRTDCDAADGGRRRRHVPRARVDGALRRRRVRGRKTDPVARSRATGTARSRIASRTCGSTSASVYTNTLPAGHVRAPERRCRRSSPGSSTSR